MHRVFGKVTLLTNRAAVVLTCFMVPLLYVADALTEDLNGKPWTDQITRYESRLGPLKLGARELTVILNLIEYQGASEGFERTVETFSIVDKEGRVHYQKTFGVTYGDQGLEESMGVSAHVLESKGRPGFTHTPGGLEASASKEHAWAGLILSYAVTPSAPSSGVSCQVFTLQGDHLVPLFAPLTVYGKIYDLPPGSNAGAVSLFDDDTMKFGVWTGWFEVIVPVKVLDGLRVVPLHYTLTFDYNAFDVIVERRETDKETFVRLFNQPAAPATPRHVVIRKGTKVEFLWVYARVSIAHGGPESALSVDEMPWLKVRIDGEEGFVRDGEDLLALGIHPAG